MAFLYPWKGSSVAIRTPTEVFAALGQPVLAYGARSSRDQVQQAGRGMTLPTCQVDDAGEFTRAPEASVLVVPHMLIDPQHPHPCETGGVIRCGLQVAWEAFSPTSGSEPDLFADLVTSSESRADGAATASSLDFSRPIGDQIPVILDGYRRVDNVTDATLASYREHYEDAGSRRRTFSSTCTRCCITRSIGSATRMT